MNAIANTIEPAVAYVCERVREGDFNSTAPALASVNLYLDIFRPPEYLDAEPAAWLKVHESEIRNDRCSILTEQTSSCVFDPAQAWACLDTLIHSVELYEDAILVTEVFEDEGMPKVTLTLDGPGAFLSRLRVGERLPITFDQLCERWTVATRGGKIRKSPSGLELRLKGMREPGPSQEDLLPLLERFKELQSLIRAWGRAEESGTDYEPLRHAAARETDAFLALLDGDVRQEPADVRRTLEDALAAYAQEALERSVAIDLFVEGEIPPIAIMRRGLVRVWESILEHAFLSCPRGGRVSFMVEYAPAPRQVSVAVEIEGTQCETHETVYLSSVRRGIEALHGGKVEIAHEKNCILISMQIPDSVGETLDAWLPGWERFCPQSRQMLRLLKSGGQTLPEEFLLGGILENELEQWLLPLLSQPAVINIVHDEDLNLAGLPGASRERMEKVLAQIKREKVKKETVRPPHAGELLWAFRKPERARIALRLDHLDDESLRDLCSGLIELPPDFVRCLRLIARVVGEGQASEA